MGEMIAFSISGLGTTSYPCMQMKLSSTLTLYTKINSIVPFQIVIAGKFIINLSTIMESPRDWGRTLMDLRDENEHLRQGIANDDPQNKPGQ
jgi:hypothetical protein